MEGDMKKSTKSQDKQQPTYIDAGFGKWLHPLAEKVPAMIPAEMVELAENIKVDGLRDPITLDHTGKFVVDGRHRLLACARVGVKLTKKHWVRLPKNTNIARFIISRLTHRNLTVGQR